MRLSGLSALRFAVVLALVSAFASPILADDSVPDLAGIYELEGETVIGETKVRFVVTGKLVIKQDGQNLSTFVEGRVLRSAGTTGPAAFALVAHGDAIVKGKDIAGITDVQTIYSEVRELDVSAPYIPKRAGPTFKATSKGKVLGEGEISFAMASDTDVFGPGADRVTTLHATRVARKATELKEKK